MAAYVDHREGSGSGYDQMSDRHSRQLDTGDESFSRPSSPARWHLSASPSDDNVDIDADEDERRRLIERRRRKHRHCRSHHRHRRGISSSAATRSTWVSFHSLELQYAVGRYFTAWLNCGLVGLDA